MIRFTLIFVLLVVMVGCGDSEDNSLSLAEAGAIPLSEFQQPLRENLAPDFWALNGVFPAQETDASSSSAAVAAVMNGLALESRNNGETPRVTETAVLEAAEIAEWTEAVKSSGTGVTLEQLNTYMLATFKAYELPYTVEMVSTKDREAATRAAFIAALVENEKTADDFIVINFVPGYALGIDPSNHFSVIGAFDQKRDLVLIMDVDRSWFEPYWVGVNALLNSMASVDATVGGPRGYLKVHR